MIKKTLVVLFAALSLYSCDKVDELTKFNIDYTTSITIPSTTVLNVPLDILTPEVSTNSESSFENNNTRTDLVESVKLNELRLDIITPDDGDFNFLNEIEIYISAEGLPEVLIASAIAIPNDDSRSINLDVEDVELKEYIKVESYSLRTKTLTDETINSDHEIDIYSEFRVDAEILGV